MRNINPKYNYDKIADKLGRDLNAPCFVARPKKGEPELLKQDTEIVVCSPKIHEVKRWLLENRIVKNEAQFEIQALYK